MALDLELEMKDRGIYFCRSRPNLDGKIKIAEMKFKEHWIDVPSFDVDEIIMNAMRTQTVIAGEEFVEKYGYSPNQIDAQSLGDPRIVLVYTSATRNGEIVEKIHTDRSPRCVFSRSLRGRYSVLGNKFVRIWDVKPFDAEEARLMTYLLAQSALDHAGEKGVAPRSGEAIYSPDFGLVAVKINNGKYQIF